MIITHSGELLETSGGHPEMLNLLVCSVFRERGVSYSWLIQNSIIQLVRNSKLGPSQNHCTLHLMRGAGCNLGPKIKDKKYPPKSRLASIPQLAGCRGEYDIFCLIKEQRTRKEKGVFTRKHLKFCIHNHFKILPPASCTGWFSPG